MAHWAELDENNIVTRVVVTSNEEPDEGYQWLIKTFGGRWLQTSYNTVGGIHLLGGTPLRKNFASVGSFYDEEKDAFIPPKPNYELDNISFELILNNETCLWELVAV